MCYNLSLWYYIFVFLKQSRLFFNKKLYISMVSEFLKLGSLIHLFLLLLVLWDSKLHALVIVIGVLGTGGESRVEAVIPYSTSCWEPWDEGGDLSVRWGTDLETQKLRKRRVNIQGLWAIFQYLLRIEGISCKRIIKHASWL